METAPEDEVKAFFHHIDKYALSDLQWMLDCANYSSDQQRLAVPIALSCFAILDIIGFLLTDLKSHSEPERQLKKSKENIRKALTHLFSSEFTQIERDVLVEIYRHGTTHSFFPKYAAIHNTRESNTTLSKVNGTFNFNVHPFCEILIQKIKNLATELTDKETKNNLLFNLKIYLYDAKKSISSFSSQLTSTTSATITTTVYRP